MITATLDIHTPKPVPKVFTYRNFKSIDPLAFNEYLSSCDWSVITQDSSSMEECLDALYENLNAALDVFAPERTFEYRGGRQAWYTAYHRALITERDRLYRRYRRSRLVSELYEYRFARDLAHEETESAKLVFFYDRLKDLTDPQEIWKELRHLSIAPTLVSNMTNFSAEELNVHFASVSFDTAAPALSRFLDSLDDNQTDPKFHSLL